MDEPVAGGNQFVGRGNRGNIRGIISKFPSWAENSQRQCVSTLSSKGIGGDLNALCAWLKDRSTGTTYWRGKGKRMTEQQSNDTTLAQMFAESELIAAGPIYFGEYNDGPEPYWFREFDRKTRDRLAARGAAMPGGRYPIVTRQDAINARRAIGRTPPGGRAAVMAHIRRRERALGISHSDNHKAATAMGPMPEPQPFLRSPGSARYMTDGVHVYDLGVDTTGAHASAEPDDDPDSYNDPSPADVHIPGPVGLSPGNYGGRYQSPRGGMLQPLRRVISNVVGGDRQAQQRQYNDLFWTDPQQFCMYDDVTGDFRPTLSMQPGSPYGAMGMRPRASFVDMYSGYYDDPYGEDPYGDADDTGGNYDLDDDPDDPVPMTKGPSVPPGNHTVVFYPAKFSERFFALGRPKHDVADLCASASLTTPPTSRLFVEFSENAWKKFVENGNKIPYLPKPGIYTHPKYGTVVITRERNQRFAENMNNHVYQSKIPLDLEHQGKLSGAAGWITGITLNPDGSGDAHVEIEPMGQAMLKENRFLFVSPEWLDDWEQPHTNKMFKDVPIGGALTTRPFYKDESLRSLVASEAGITVIDWPPTRRKGEETMSSPNPPQITPQQFSELQAALAEQTKQFAEMQTKLTAAEEKNKLLEENNKKFGETLATQAANTRRKAFTDEVMGRSDANNIRWFTDPSLDAEGKPKMSVEGHVEYMEKLAKAFGEDSPELRQYIEMQRMHAKQMHEGNTLRVQGVPGAQTSESNAQAGKLATAIKRFRDAEPSLTLEQAEARAYSEDPSLYDSWLNMHPKQHG